MLSNAFITETVSNHYFEREREYTAEHFQQTQFL